jgi:hypothetical protein
MKRKRLELPEELVRNIWSFVDINTRVENKIEPFKLNKTFIYIKPKIVHRTDYVVQILSSMYISYKFSTKETLIVSVKDDNVYFNIFDENYNIID